MYESYLKKKKAKTFNLCTVYLDRTLQTEAVGEVWRLGHGERDLAVFQLDRFVASDRLGFVHL